MAVSGNPQCRPLAESHEDAEFGDTPRPWPKTQSPQSEVAQCCVTKECQDACSVVPERSVLPFFVLAVLEEDRPLTTSLWNRAYNQ